MKLNKEDLKTTSEAARALSVAFIWKESDEGYDYWTEIVKKLYAYANQEVEENKDD